MTSCKELWLIRHGEAASNAGALGAAAHDAPLTEKGHRQARQVADALEGAPDLIVRSPFLRARQTAQPTMDRFPEVRSEDWPVQEFTYIDFGRRPRMTELGRRLRVSGYWRRRDPDSIDGPGAESFAQFFARVQDLWLEFLRRDERRILVFSHSMFIYGLDLSLRLRFREPGRRTMRIFRELSSGVAIPNGGILKLRVDGSGEVFSNYL